MDRAISNDLEETGSDNDKQNLAPVGLDDKDKNFDFQTRPNLVTRNKSPLTVNPYAKPHTHRDMGTSAIDNDIQGWSHEATPDPKQIKSSIDKVIPSLKISRLANYSIRDGGGSGTERLTN